MEAHDLIDAVHDWKTFLDFARQLSADRFEAAESELENPPHLYAMCGANGWQNVSIEGFLNGAIAWAESTKFGTTQGLSADNPWRQFAVFLYCGKIYE